MNNINIAIDGPAGAGKSTIAINNFKCHYNLQGHGEPLLLVHGLGENLTSWEFQLEELSQYYTVIALDLRGHGRSEVGEDDISLKLMAEDIKELIKSLKLAPVHLCGLSMGGIIAQLFAAQYPKDVKSLILVDTNAYVPEKLVAKVLPQRLDFIEENSMEDVGKYMAGLCLGPDASANLLTRVAQMFTSNNKDIYSKLTAQVMQADCRTILEKINSPTLIIVGELDKVTPVATSEFLHINIPASTLHIIPHAGHLTKLEAPEEFNKAVVDFIQQIN